MKRILYLVKINEENTDVLRRDVSYIRKMLMDQGDVVDVYDFKRRLFLSNNGVEEKRAFPAFLRRGKLSLLYNFLAFIRFIKSVRGTYDYVHIFSVRDEYLLVPGLIRKVAPKLIVSFYGSDINSRNFVKNNFRRLYRLVDVATAASGDFRDKVVRTIDISGFSEKAKVLLLPQDHLDLYEGLGWADKREKKLELGIAEDQTVIVVGSCIHLNEQHEAVIAELKKLDNHTGYTLIFPFSSKWEDNSALQREMEALIKKELPGFTTMVIPEFMTHERMRDIRFASDVFLNLRKIDQFCASMIESNYSFTEVITGSWLPYSDYRDGMHINTVDEITELAPLLIQVLTASEAEKQQRMVHNKTEASHRYSHSVSEQWMNLYRK